MGFDHNAGKDLGFAFNNSDFSDRLLRIEIVAHPPESETCQTLTDCGAALKIKRRRVDVANKENEGDKAAEGRSSDERVLRVETFHVNSLLLASNSPFFFKLFSNGILESKKQCVTLRIDASEEDALMELLNFMYCNTLRANTTPALLDVLVAADKFEVTSCVRHCYCLLRDMAMTPEFAILCLDLPTNILKSEAVKPLKDAANMFLVACYKHILKHEYEVMKLPLVGIEAILASDDLHVPTEDAVFDMALKWTENHYQNSEERRDILSIRLSRYIRFPYMSLEKLREVLTCSYFNEDFATKAVLDAMFFKSNNSHLDSTKHLFPERTYILRPVKVVEFELPRQHSVVYLDLKREECVGLFPSDQISSQTFVLSGHKSFFSAQYMRPSQSFVLLICVEKKASARFAFNCLVSARSKPSEEYITKCKDNYEIAPGNATSGNAVRYGRQFLFSIPWNLFVADDSPYFINEVFQIRAEITVKH